MCSGALGGRVSPGDVANIAYFAVGVKHCPSLFLAIRATLGTTVGKRRTETVEDLLRPVLEARTLTAWCQEAGVRPWTILRWRKGVGGRVHTGTVLAVAQALGVPPARVRAAIEASRAAAQ